MDPRSKNLPRLPGHWIPRLPDGVSFGSRGLFDQALGVRIPIPPSVLEVLKAVDGKETLADQECQENGRRSRILFEMNQTHLLNFVEEAGGALRPTGGRLGGGRGPRVPFRIAVPGSGTLSALAGILRAFWVAARLSTVWKILFITLPLCSVPLFLSGLFLGGIAILSGILGLVLHEWGHLLALGTKRKTAYITVDGKGISVFSSQVEGIRKFFFAVSGPLLPVAAGLILLILLFPVRGGLVCVALLPLLLHLVLVFPPFPDGRLAWGGPLLKLETMEGIDEPR